eukprot:TRINITY_DN2496_c0_g1_i1.p1 TRINITY_DN2496_c0_g1~~TRINITY_DN2496_c0_g1_i1.p1  ORF type:complete len:148 (+),score=8.65 TRINITY_DN2496_c0_g1_i1:324-767(+)
MVFFLTHAHLGHYIGLLQLGKEAMNASNMPVFCTPRMAAFLRSNAPFSALVSRKNIAIRTMQPDGDPIVIETGGNGATVEVFALSVPHRDELSDTVCISNCISSIECLVFARHRSVGRLDPCRRRHLSAHCERIGARRSCFSRCDIL